MSTETIAQQMKKLGFTAYESKAYISLLQNHPATRYEVSKSSGVPRSAIYDTMRKLEEQGVVNGLYTEPKKYIPLPPDQLFNLLERQFKDRLQDIRSSLEDFETSAEPGHLWNVVGYENMIGKAREMIERATKKIYISVWNRELLLLKDELEAATKRGVSVVAFSFTSIDIDAKYIYSYNLEETELEKIWGHKIILVVDRNELLMGEADNQYHKRTAWTKNQAIVDIATNHMILDITLYGIRNDVDVSERVVSMQNGDSKELQSLLNKNGAEI